MVSYLKEADFQHAVSKTGSYASFQRLYSINISYTIVAREYFSYITQVIHITICYKSFVIKTLPLKAIIYQAKYTKKLIAEIRDVMEEADSMNDQLESVRIKNIIFYRIFSISSCLTR